MPSLDIFCLSIFIAFSRLSRTSTSTGLPNEFSMESEWVPDRRVAVKRRSGNGARHPPQGVRHQLSALRLGVLVEQCDGQAVKFGIRALRDDLVNDLVVGGAPEPGGDELSEEFALFRLRCREHLHSGNVDHPAFIHRST